MYRGKNITELRDLIDNQVVSPIVWMQKLVRYVHKVQD